MQLRPGCCLISLTERELKSRWYFTQKQRLGVTLEAKKLTTFVLIKKKGVTLEAKKLTAFVLILKKEPA